MDSAIKTKLAFSEQHEVRTVQSYSFQLHQGLQGLQAVLPLWTALVNGMASGSHFYQSPQWYRAFLDNTDQPDSIFWFVIASAGEKVVAVFPLQYERFSVAGLEVRLLGNIEDDQLQLVDFVFDRTMEYAGVLAAFLRWLYGQKTLRWDALRLRRIAENSSVYYAIAREAPRFTQVTQYDSSGQFDVSVDYAHATVAMSGTAKRNLRRLYRRAEQSAPLRLERVDTPERLPVALDHFFAVEASGWKGGQGANSAILCNPTLVRFFRELAATFGKTRQCVIALLWHGDEVVAVEFCLLIDRTLNVLKVGYRETAQSFAPGNQLLDLMIHHTCTDPGIDVLSLVNDPPWAHIFKPARLGVFAYFIPNNTLRGILNLVALRLKRVNAPMFASRRGRTTALRRSRPPAQAEAET